MFFYIAYYVRKQIRAQGGATKGVLWTVSSGGHKQCLPSAQDSLGETRLESGAASDDLWGSLPAL